MTKDSRDHDIKNDHLKNTNDSLGSVTRIITRQRIHKDSWTLAVLAFVVHVSQHTSDWLMSSIT